MKKKTKAARTYSLCEAVADISYIAGKEKYYSGNARADIATFIEWAQTLRIDTGSKYCPRCGWDSTIIFYTPVIKENERKFK